MSKKQIIGILKKLTVTSKVDNNGRTIHTVATQIELLENKTVENVHQIQKSLNQPIRLDFDAVQLELA